MKKSLALLLAVIMTLSVFVACDTTTAPDGAYEITSMEQSYTVDLGGSLDFRSLFTITDKET